MKSRPNHSIFIFLAIITLILTASIHSFADTTRIIYDEVNRVIRIESGGGTATITATAGNNGSISPAGALGVRVGDSQTFTIT